MNDFASLGLAEPLLRAVAAEGYVTPTPIQSLAIPAVLAGSDVLGLAQTGTGKTAAFVLPLLDRLVRDGARAKPRACLALILAPTRELAGQIGESIRAYGRGTRIRHAVVIGGVSPGAQVRAMAGGVEILVATPGRLLDHVGAGAIRLADVNAVVLDEADQMLDLGFIPAIRRIMGQLPRERRTLLFSATMPRAIRALAEDFLRAPKEVLVGPVSRPVERVEQYVVPVDATAKRRMLVDILSRTTIERALIFTRTKRGADRVSEHLEKSGIPAAAIHGNKSQNHRERTLRAFRDGTVRILVATDIAARGIDVDGVSHVVNYELPNIPESYVHRIGRTARAGATGIAISLCDPSERAYLRDIERLIGRSLTDAQPARPRRRAA